MNHDGTDHDDRQPPVPPPPPHGAPPPTGHPHPAPGSGQTGDDVWGVRPPALGQPPVAQPPHGQHGYPGSEPGGHGAGPHQQHGRKQGGASATGLDRGLSALQRSPLRRDTDDGIIGGVAAGLAKQMGVSTAAVRIGAVALALFFGSGIAAYLIAWALLPDQSGRTHVEKGVRQGDGGSLVILALGGLAALGMVSTLMEGIGWLVPIAVTVGVVYYIVNAAKKKDGGTGA